MNVLTTAEIVKGDLKIEKTLSKKFNLTKSHLCLPNPDSLKLYNDWKETKWIHKEDLLEWLDDNFRNQDGTKLIIRKLKGV